jgi:hypothetical protein
MGDRLIAAVKEVVDPIERRTTALAMRYVEGSGLS